MPRRSNSSIHEKKIPTMPTVPKSPTVPTVPKSPTVPTVPTAINYQKPSLLNTIKEGIALGVGSSIGHRIVGMMIPSQIQKPSNKLEEYEQCMKKYDDVTCQKILGDNN